MNSLERLAAPSNWVGRRVRRADNGDDAYLGDAVVLAVDDTEYAPSAWIKYPCEWTEKRCWPSYRSVDLSDLEDIETGEGGPRWGTPVGDVPEATAHTHKDIEDASHD